MIRKTIAIGLLDLHAFAPKEIPSVVEEYIEQCREAGMSEVRLIHGKGTGTQRAVVQRLLGSHPGVISFTDAPPEAGGWGATIVRLKPPELRVPGSECHVPG